MKCDAGTHEGTCTYVVLSGDTIMFQSFGERVPNELTVSALYTMQIEEICLPERKCSVSVWVGGASPLGGTSLRRNSTWTFSGYLVLVYREPAG